MIFERRSLLSALAGRSLALRDRHRLPRDCQRADALVSATSDVAGTVTLLVAGTPTTSVAIPAQGTAPQDWAISLGGLTRDLEPATYVTVTLQFERAGRVTLDVPVHAGDTGLEDREAEQEPYEVE